MSHADLAQTAAGLKPGDHLSCIYGTEEEHRAILTSFMSAGLNRNGKIVYVAGPENAAKAMRWLREAGFDAERYLTTRQIMLLSNREKPIRVDLSNPKAIVASISQVMERAMSEGYDALWGISEMIWALGSPADVKTLSAYEVEMTQFLPGSRLIGLGLYDRRLSSPQVLMKSLLTHPTVVIGTNVYENSYYLPPAELLTLADSDLIVRQWSKTLADRAEAERAIRESEARYRAVVESQTELICRWQPDTTLTFVNDAYCRFFGKKHEELLGHSYLPLMGLPESARVDRPAPPLSSGSPVHNHEYSLRSSSGEMRCIHWTTQAFFDGQGNPVEYQCVGHDVTERRQAEVSLRESEEKFRFLAEQSPSMIFINRNGKVVYANAKCVELVGYSKEEFCSPDFDFLCLVPQEYRDWTLHSFRRHMQNEEIPAYESAVVAKDGRRIECLISTKLIPYEGGKAILGIVTEIGELKRAQEELKRANRHKDEFLANMSHDLRTPLASMLSAVELLKSGRAQGKEPEYLESVTRNGKHLLRLLNDLVDLARIESGKLAIVPGMCSVYSLVSEARGQVDALARKARVHVDIESVPGARVWADRTRVIQILDNLLTNAVKFTPSGGKVSIGWRPTGVTCDIWVKDTGIGIPQDQRPKLFSRFERTNTAPLHEGIRKGVGLGLAVARLLVELQGGRIGFESEEGKGTTFRFTLPTTAPDALSPSLPTGEPPAQRQKAVSIRGSRILIIEDDAEIADILQTFFRPEGVDAVRVATGEQGLQAAREGHPEVILLDMRLPDMDGYSLASQLRADAATREIPVIAVTAQAMSNDREKCLAAGCTDYVSKPFDFVQLRNAIASALEKGRQPAG